MEKRKPEELAYEVLQRKRRSYDWMENNFYPEWEQVYKSYKCEREPERDENGKIDDTQNSVGMPDTWSHVRRTTARGTAQIPHFEFRAADQYLGEIIGRTLMYQWDRGGTQRPQKRHFTQATLFGWSVRPWWWAVDENIRTRRVDIMDEQTNQDTLALIAKQYRIPIRLLTLTGDPNVDMQVMAVRAKLLAANSRGGLLRIKYPYRSYEGPKTEFLFIGDCYPEPNFQTLQSSGYFIVERKRRRDWLLNLSRAYPDLKPGIIKLLTDKPHGTNPAHYYGRDDARNLRSRMAEAINRTTDLDEYSVASSEVNTPEWLLTEQYIPGPRGSVTYLEAEGTNEGNWIGSIPTPYDLDGKIPFTELVLIDDLLSGIGDSTARVMRGLQILHDRQVNVRTSLADHIQRPLVGTTDPELYENPDLLKRHSGLRLVYLNRGMGSVQVIGEQAAMAAIATGLQDESAIQRQIQMATGDNNMSMSANVDPQQARTATGARIMAYNQDILTKDLVDMFTVSLNADAEMMYLLNRSELSDALYVPAQKYRRNYSTNQDILRDEWIRVDPLQFQVDGEVVVKAGSTLADDDEARVVQAQTLWGVASSRPDLFNVEKARDELLIAFGKGKELQQWAAPPKEPPPQEVKASLSVAVKWPELGEQERAVILQKAGITIVPEGPPPGAPPEMQGPSPEQYVAASSYAAARGNSPFEQGMPV